MGFPWKIKEAKTKYTYPTNVMSAWQIEMQVHVAWTGLGYHTSLFEFTFIWTQEDDLNETIFN